MYTYIFDKEEFQKSKLFCQSIDFTIKSLPNVHYTSSFSDIQYCIRSSVESRRVDHSSRICRLPNPVNDFQLLSTESEPDLDKLLQPAW